MARPASPEQFSALQRIRDSIAQHGEELGPRLARADYQSIPKPTWCRWVAQVRQEDALFAADPSPVAAAPVRVQAEPMQDAEAVMVPAGVLDFFSQVGAMMAACDALQDYA
jgi:hypothetical protein